MPDDTDDYFKPDALIEAAEGGHVDKVQQMLDAREVDVNALARRGTALHTAAMCGGTANLQLLLNADADVNLMGGEFMTALQAAAFSGNHICVRMLLDRGAEVNRQGGCRGTALQAAAGSNSMPAVKLLLDYGADISLEGGQYGFALQAAA